MTNNIDFTPLYRSSVGFDRIFDLLNDTTRAHQLENWPPYDILRDSEDAYRIRMAVAGFSSDELTASYEPNLLIVRGAKAEQDGSQYLHRGLNVGPFERRFRLADFVEVTGARLDNGLLTIKLERQLPDAMKPRRIQIGTAAEPVASMTQQGEGQQQAA